MTTLPSSSDDRTPSPLTSDEMLENYRRSIRAELDDVDRITDRPLAAIAAFWRIRYDAVTTVSAVLAQGPLLREPFPGDEALESANAMLRPIRRQHLEKAAKCLDRSDFQNLQSRAETLDRLLDQLEAHVGGRKILTPGFPSWTSLRDAYRRELERFELWALNVEGAAPPAAPLSDREREVLACLSDRPILAKEIADRISRSSEGSVRNIISDLRSRGLPIHTRHGAGYHIDPDDPMIQSALSTTPR